MLCIYPLPLAFVYPYANCPVSCVCRCWTELELEFETTSWIHVNVLGVLYTPFSVLVVPYALQFVHALSLRVI
jgi:hypothetical protein